MSTAPTPTATWIAGSAAVIDRLTRVTIDRVSPSGRVTVGDRTFDHKGIERCSGNRRARLEMLTVEIEAEMAFVERARRASREVRDAVDRAERWACDAMSTWGNKVPDAADVEAAERLIAAISKAMSTDAAEASQ